MQVLVHHRNEQSGLCTPSNRRIAAFTRFSRRKVWAVLKRLRERQILLVEPYKRGVNYTICANVLTLICSGAPHAPDEWSTPCSRQGEKGEAAGSIRVAAGFETALSTRAEEAEKRYRALIEK